MNLSALELITLFSSLLLFILAGIFLFYPHGKKLSNYILTSFMIANIILLTNFFLTLKFPWYISEFPILYQIEFHCYLLLGPLIYLYIISLCQPQFQLSLKSIFHFLPYIIITGLSITFILINSQEWRFFNSFYRIVLNFQIGFYIAYSLVILKRYRLQLKELYSSFIKIDLAWVDLVLYFFIFMWLTDLTNFVLNANKLLSPGISYYLTCQSISTDLILSISLIYKGMRQTAIPSVIVSGPAYILTKQDISVYEEYRNQLVQYVLNEKPYLLPELGLDDLAKNIGISSKQLSQTINFCFKQNFNSYINQHRVEEAKRIIEADTYDKKTVFEILLDSGFNSKSVFNKSFKELNGYTPKEYREKLKKIRC